MRTSAATSEYDRNFIASTRVQMHGWRTDLQKLELQIPRNVLPLTRTI